MDHLISIHVVSNYKPYISQNRMLHIIYSTDWNDFFLLTIKSPILRVSNFSAEYVLISNRLSFISYLSCGHQVFQQWDGYAAPWILDIFSVSYVLEEHFSWLPPGRVSHLLVHSLLHTVSSSSFLFSPYFFPALLLHCRPHAISWCHTVVIRDHIITIDM